jgi:hypothetical protein
MVLKLISILPLLILIISCRETSTISTLDETTVLIKSDTSDSSDNSDSSRIFIIDHTGKDWDVTHAVNEYGFNPGDFQYGLGPFAIRPILEPKFLSPNDPGYPSANESNIVIGTVINGIARAYPLSILRSHEVADEKFGDTYVAVAY